MQPRSASPGLDVEIDQPHQGRKKHFPAALKANGERPTTHDDTSEFNLEVQFMPLSLTFSRFCPQLISFQRFCSCSPANPMIPEYQRLRGIPISPTANCQRPADHY